VIERGLRSIADANRPAIVYCHPYEFNADELGEYSDVSRRVAATQGFGRASFAKRVGTVLPKLSFGRLSDVLAAWGLR